MRKLPDWLPGTGFKSTAREWAATLNEMIESPYQYVKDQMVIFELRQLTGHSPNLWAGIRNRPTFLHVQVTGGTQFDT